MSNVKRIKGHTSRIYTVHQGSATYGQGILAGPRPFFFFHDGYAPINRRNDSNLLAKTFFLGLHHRYVLKKSEFLAKTFFWSTGMVAARWNLVRTECGPLVQKVADPCGTLYKHLEIDRTDRNLKYATNVLQAAEVKTVGKSL